MASKSDGKAGIVNWKQRSRCKNANTKQAKADDKVNYPDKIAGTH